MTTRTHETILVGLRRIIRDPNASAKQRLEAIKLLMSVEGLVGEEVVKQAPVAITPGYPKSQRLIDLLAAEEGKTG